MIRINLLPPHLRPVKRTPLPYLASGLVFVLAVLIMATVFIATQARISGKRAELATNRADLDGLKSIVEESNRLAQQQQQLADKIKTIDDIVKDRIIWSRQLWNLSRLAPDNLWYSSISVESKTFTETKMVLNPQTKKTEPKQIPVTKPILKVSGYVTKGLDGSYEVTPLMEATTSDSEFSSMFQLEPPMLKDTEFAKFPVKSFTLEFVISPGGKPQ